MYSQGRRLKVPKGFSTGKFEPTSKARPKAKGQRFLAFGLAEDVAKCSHLDNPEGGLQYSSEGVRWVLKGPPKGSTS